MILFYGIVFVLAVLGMALFSSSLVLCLLVMVAAAGGFACELLFRSKWKRLSGLLLVLCLGLCFLTGRNSSASGTDDYGKAVQDAADKVEDGRLDDAKARLELLDENCGPTDASRYVWASLYADLEDYGTARDYLEQAEDRHCLEWYGRMEELYVSEGTPEAMEALQELYLSAADDLPEEARMQLMAGLAQLDRGQTTSAQYYLQRAAVLDESDPLAPYYMGVSYYKLGNEEEAAYWFGTSISRGADEELQSYMKWYAEQMEVTAS